MYTSGSELWEGFRKNFFAGFGYNIPFFVGMGLLHFVTFILPILSLPFLILLGFRELLIADLTAIGIMLIQRFMVDRWFNWSLAFGFLHPLAVFWYESLGVRVLLDYFMNESAHWKEREI